MAGGTQIFTAGTSKTEIVNLPMSGNWCGTTRVKISTHTTNATIHEWVFIKPNVTGGKTWYRRTNVTSANNWYNGTLKADVEQIRWLFQGECLMRITYTSSNPLGVSFETTREVLPFIYNDSSLAQWNISSSTPWTGPGNNLSANATERSAGSATRLDGVNYWRPSP